MPVWELSFVAVLIVLNGFFAMSELAIVSARRSRLDVMARQGSRGAQRALALAEDPTGFLSTVQVGITLIGIFAGAFSGAALAGPLAEPLAGIPAIAPWAGTIAFVLVVAATTYLSLIVGELVPKRIALQNAEAIAATVAGPMSAIARIARPLVWFLRVSTEAVLRLLRIKPTQEHGVTEEEVRAMIAQGTRVGVFEETERKMLEGVLRFADRPVRAVMVPRHEIVWLAAGSPLDAQLDTIRDSHHSRFPVCGESMDDVLGVVHVKDILDLKRRGGSDLSEVLQAPLFVSEGLLSLRLLERFRTSRLHMAVVLDEYGALQGIVTPVDILTSIAGDLPESAGDEGPAAVRREDGSWLVDAAMPVDEAAALLDIDGLRSQDYATLAGHVLAVLGSIPSEGDAFDDRGWRFEVIDMDGRRIDKLLLRRLEPAG